MTGLGHGHVHPRPDGVKARCGGPALCGKCAQEAMLAGFRGDPSAVTQPKGSPMDHADAARRLGVAEHQVQAVDKHDAGHVVTLVDGGRWLVADSVARVYVPEVDDPKPTAGKGKPTRATE